AAMRAMYAQATGGGIDGVIALDVPTLAAGLSVTGPVKVSSIAQTLTADNLASIVLDQLYRVAPGRQVFRHQQLSDAATELFGRITSVSTDTIALGRRLGDAAAGGHLRLWSSRPDEEAVFERSGLGGGPAAVQPDR